MQSYSNRDDFYAAYPALREGWGDLSHMSAPGGWETAFIRLRRTDEQKLRGDGTWMVHLVAAHEDLLYLEDPQSSVSGVVAATNHETGEVLVLRSTNNLRSMFEHLKKLNDNTPEPTAITVEQLENHLP